jgi:hypothetical protein
LLIGIRSEKEDWTAAAASLARQQREPYFS